MDGTFAALPHDDVLRLVLQIAVLLGSARLLGEIARRLRQPAVLGEILAGVLLGPSLLAGVAPSVGRWIVPQTALQGHLLEVVSLIGVMLLLVITGLETDIALIRRRAGTAFGIAVGGLILPFASGLGLGLALPDRLLVDPSQRGIFALFLATAMSISAIPVLAKVLLDLDLMRRDVGQTMLAAGMIDDITGWTLLGLVAALAAGTGGLEVGTLAVTVGTVVLFLLLTVTVGDWMVRTSLVWVQDRSGSRDALLTLVVVLAFGWGALSHALRLEPVIGAFAIGILLGRMRRLPPDVTHKLEGIALGVFAPIFFAATGLEVDLRTLLDPQLALVALAVLAVATFGKLVGVYLGARMLSGQDHWSALAYGSGLNARGAVEIIVATIGLSLGILSPGLFSVIVVMAVVTSLMAPFALRFTLARVIPEESELRRLEREALTAAGIGGSLRRILVPVRPRPGPGVALTAKVALIGRLAGGRSLGVTVLSAADPDERGEAEATVRQVAARLAGVQTSTRILTSVDPVRAVIDEAARDYDLLVLGASRAGVGGEFLFGSAVDEIVRMAPCPSLVVSGRGEGEDWMPRRILVPTDGGEASRKAADLAFAIAGPDTTLTILHVVQAESSAVRSVIDTSPIQRLDMAHQIVSQLRERGEALGFHTEARVEMGSEPEIGILEAAASVRADLVFLGTSARAGTQRLFLGPRVENVLTACPCPVAVLNT